ncbi:hypothetical protein BKA82DRAFT_4019567 [Pisolithus tinctorius]|nr:hypothetical protein BKA82DRAFT_4019567 [Pisolithus tinctorius]
MSERCKLGSNEVINLALSKWKPPVWSSKKSCERREALKEKGKAVQPQGEEEQAPAVGIPPPTSGPSGGAPALQEQIADAPLGSTPASDRFNHMRLNRSLNKGLGQAPELSPPQGHNLLTRQKGPSPLVGSLGAFPSYHQMPLPLTVLSKLGGSSSTKRRGTLAGAKTASPHSWPWSQGYWGHLAGQMTPMQRPTLCLYECLVPVPQSHRAQNVWMSGQEYVNGIIANGGENNPQVMAKIKPLKKALTKPCPPSDVGLREWYECQAQAIGCTINQVPLGHTPLRADDQQIISVFASAAFIYDLPHCPHGGASTVRGNPPAKDSEPEEGEMTDDLFEDEDRLQM